MRITREGNFREFYVVFWTSSVTPQLYNTGSLLSAGIILDVKFA